MSFDPQLLALVLSEQNRKAEQARRDQLLSERRGQEALKVGMGIAMHPDSNVADWLPLLREQGLTPAHESALLDANKAERAARKRKEAEAETAAAGQSAAGVLTNPLLGPELGRDQVLSQLRAVEAAGNQTQLGAAPLLGQVDIARTQNQVQMREAGRAEAFSLAKESRAEARDIAQQQFGNENVLRDEFLSGSKDFLVQRNAFDRVLASAESPDAAGDLALIFNYLKVLDPGSTVREGEFEQVGRAGGLPAAVQSMFNRVEGGKRLPDKFRNEIVSRSRRFYAKGAGRQKDLEREYKSRARRTGLDARNVVPNFRKSGEGPQAPEEIAGAKFSHEEPGGVRVFIDPVSGEAYRVTPDAR